MIYYSLLISHHGGASRLYAAGAKEESQRLVFVARREDTLREDPSQNGGYAFLPDIHTDSVGTVHILISVSPVFEGKLKFHNSVPKLSAIGRPIRKANTTVRRG